MNSLLYYLALPLLLFKPYTLSQPANMMLRTSLPYGITGLGFAYVTVECPNIYADVDVVDCSQMLVAALRDPGLCKEVCEAVSPLSAIRAKVFTGAVNALTRDAGKVACCLNKRYRIWSKSIPGSQARNSCLHFPCLSRNVATPSWRLLESTESSGSIDSTALAASQGHGLTMTITLLISLWLCKFR